ncbi:LysR family transcriptional regulator [Nocardia panacis]|uniref:LysR family transcriptional regulator n=1 Tax=Nocardia panacis TaxID=2340916 RepID=A0A3A4K8J6_9NOCA|nr:LysR family transcriptional regulator [Nocardia panacis]
MESFLTLAEELHFGRTAERLHISRARVSQTILAMERRIGGRLFDRTSRTVALTPLGVRLRADLAPAHRMMVEAVTRAKATARGIAGCLRVGYLGGAAGTLALEAIGAFTRTHPDIDVRVEQTRMADMFGPLRRAEVEVLITQFPVCEADLVRGPVLLRVPRLLAVPADHPLARRDGVSLEDLAQGEVFACAGAVPEYWQLHLAPERTPGGVPIRRGPTAASIPETLAMIGAGQGISPVGADVPRQYAPRGVVYVPFTDADPVEYGAVWRADGETACVRAFVAAAAELVAIGKPG